MFTYSPQEKIIVEFIKSVCLVIVVHESLVCPEQLNCCCSSEKSFSSHKFCGFPAFLCIWTLSNNDCMILRYIFSHWGWLRDSYTTITEGSNTLWCSRRINHALRAGAWKLLNLKIRVNLTYFVLWETCKYLL